MKNFSIGSEIHSLLMADSAVTAQIGNKLFPIVATKRKDENGNEIEVSFPFAVYRRTAYEPQDNKDYQGEKVYIEIFVAAEGYKQSLNIANSIADALNGKSTENIEEIKIVNMWEDWQSDTYLQNITVEITLND